MAAAAEAEGISLSIEDLMENPTVRALAGRAPVECAATAGREDHRTGQFSLVSEADRRDMPEDIEDA